MALFGLQLSQLPLLAINWTYWSGGVCGNCGNCGNCGKFGGLWELANLPPSAATERFCSNLAIFGEIWGNLGKFEHIWTKLKILLDTEVKVWYTGRRRLYQLKIWLRALLAHIYACGTCKIWLSALLARLALAPAIAGCKKDQKRLDTFGFVVYNGLTTVKFLARAKKKKTFNQEVYTLI